LARCCAAAGCCGSPAPHQVRPKSSRPYLPLDLVGCFRLFYGGLLVPFGGHYFKGVSACFPVFWRALAYSESRRRARRFGACWECLTLREDAFLNTLPTTHLNDEINDESMGYKFLLPQLVRFQHMDHILGCFTVASDPSWRRRFYRFIAMFISSPNEILIYRKTSVYNARRPQKRVPRPPGTHTSSRVRRFWVLVRDRPATGPHAPTCPAFKRSASLGNLVALCNPEYNSKPSRHRVIHVGRCSAALTRQCAVRLPETDARARACNFFFILSLSCLVGGF